MVSQAYLVEQAPRPRQGKLVLDQQVIPAAVNAFGWVEGVLAQGREAILAWPVSSILASFAFGFVGARAMRRLPGRVREARSNRSG